MNNSLRYKRFDINIRANLDGSPSRFDIVWQIRRVKDLVFSRFTTKEFESEKEAYEYGLQEARTWIDERAQ